MSWNDGAAPLFAAVRPVKLEVGAGTGDWVVKQAEAERNAANWVAVELRCDRSLMIHAKGAMRRLHNLAVLAGDAHGILRDALPSRGVAEVHVNFPQPPQWEGSEAHLVNLEFLREAHRCLVPGGAFLLTTDNERLCAAVAKRLTEDEWLMIRNADCSQAESGYEAPADGFPVPTKDELARLLSDNNGLPGISSSALP